MRNVEAHLLQEKLDEAVNHYMNAHQQGEPPPSHMDGHISLNVQDESGRVVTVMQSQTYTSQLTRQVSVGEPVEGGPWSEEMMDPEMRLAALVAHLAHQSRTSHHQPHHKVTSVRDVDSSVILDAPMRLNGYMNTQSIGSPGISVEVPPLPPLPPLQEMKRCDDDWFHNKAKGALKEDSEILTESEQPMLELRPGASPAQKHQNKKSLPHKKRISRKLKRNGGSTPQQDIVVINCTDEVPHEEILPDNFVTGVPHQDQLTEDTHHIAQEVRAILICQLCGEFYGEDQLKFYQHLKQHYEPHATIIIENPVSDLAIDKMTNTCIVDNSAALPDSIVELSLENTVPKTIYQSVDKHILYTSSDKTLYTNKVQYSMASMDKDPVVPTSEAEKTDLYDTLDKLEMYGCIKCNKTFRKQKQCEAHIKEAHNSKLDDMGEFSEPEDLMAGIHVAVEDPHDPHEPYEPHEPPLPHLTVDNGHVRQEHRHWYLRGGEGGGETGAPAQEEYCAVCPPAPPPPPPPRAHHLKEEVLQRIFDPDVQPEQNFSENIIQEQELPPEPATESPQETTKEAGDKKKSKKCVCVQCGRVFFHRNSLLYHILSHKEKQHECQECGKEFYTTSALKVHSRLHNGDKPYKCEDCGRGFRQWSDLKYHKVSLHSTQKHFKCEYCGKEFARKYSLNVHRRIHTGEKNYKCDYCTKTFRASSYRLAHMRTHTGDRPYKCPVCEKAFRVAADMRRHMLTHDKARKSADDAKKDLIKKEPKEEVVETKKEDAPKVKKVAVASTARPPVPKTEKKPKATKKSQAKKTPPNVTVRNGEHFKIINTDYPTNVEVFDTRQEPYAKFKEVYANSSLKVYNDQTVSYKEAEQERDFALLRPIFSSDLDESAKPPLTRADNTDGKMQVYTHVEKRGTIMNNMYDVKNDRDKNLNGETMEHGFLENLTALYNIPVYNIPVCSS